MDGILFTAVIFIAILISALCVAFYGLSVFAGADVAWSKSKSIALIVWAGLVYLVIYAIIAIIALSGVIAKLISVLYV